MLDALLATACVQDLDRTEYEIIVIDNGSRDRTRAVVESYCSKFSNVRYVFEGKPGLSPARDRGYREARGEYVAYTDDDCKLPPQWLTVAKGIVIQHAPAAFGGPYYAYYNRLKPQWFKDAYRSSVPIACARQLQPNEYFLSGNNMFFRRSVLAQLGSFASERGRGLLGFSEDTEMQLRLHKTLPGQIVYYDPQLLVYHLVPPYRMTLRGAIYYNFAGSRNSAWFSLHLKLRTPLSRAQLFRQALQAVARLLFDLARTPRRDRQLYPYYQNWLYERAFQHIDTLGYLYGQWPFGGRHH